MYSELDNPVLYALLQNHKSVCIEYEDMMFYDSTFCPFGAQKTDHQGNVGLHAYSQSCSPFYVVGYSSIVPHGLTLQLALPCHQMTLEKPINDVNSEAIVSLAEHHYEDLFDLVQLVQPGYFMPKTALLGRYYGIFEGDMLIAVTGERMKMENYSEISAVVTHPSHTGKGLASQLVLHTALHIQQENKLPFLHVAAHNTKAIALYEKLGFVTRRIMPFYKYACL